VLRAGGGGVLVGPPPPRPALIRQPVVSSAPAKYRGIRYGTWVDDLRFISTSDRLAEELVRPAISVC
jgi:hypothetical protein